MRNITGLLERADVAPPPEAKLLSDEQISQMANEATDSVLTVVEKLGYVPPTVQKRREELAHKIEKIKEERLRAKLPLAKVLRGAGIKPFTPESVVKYQKAMARNRFQIFKNEPTNGGAILLTILFGLLVNIGLCYLLGRGITNLFSLDFSLGYLGWIPAIGLLPLVIAGEMKKESDHPLVITGVCLLVGSCAIISFLGPSDKEWKVMPLKDYQKDIPRPVLETVAELSTRCPEATFFVDEITKKPDPFLVVSLGNERYHIEVWREPKFDGIRAA